MLDKQKLIHNMNIRKDALQHYIDRDVTGNTLEVLAKWHEVKFWKEAIQRGEYDEINDPLAKKKELIRKFKEKERPEKLKTIEDLGLDFEQGTFDYFRELEEYKEESEWLLKIRNELSDIDFPAGVLEYSIACPEGIYLLVKELKEMYLKHKTKVDIGINENSQEKGYKFSPINWDED